MSCAAILSRGCQTSSLPQLGHHLASLCLLNQPSTSVTSSRSSVSNQHRLFHHERRHVNVSKKEHPRIILKKSFVPEVYPCLEERLRELDPVLRDPELHRKINIGLGHWESEKLDEKRKRQRAVLYKLKQDKDLCKLARDNKLKIDVTAVQADWVTEAGRAQIRILAQHCGIFKDLYGPYAYFDAMVPLTAEYNYSADEVSVVYRGNIIKPREAATAPCMRFPSPADALWTLQLTNPDGDLYKKDSECVHWLVTNIKGGDVSNGDVLVPYMPPVPPKGVGYQRMVFVLYRQTGAIIDQDQYRIHDPACLRSRSFSTYQFYKQQEAAITPAGLCWYNTDWDTSLNEYYHKVLGMKEPVYEYEFPKPYLRPQTHFPKRRNFGFYMDMHRDSKQISKEMLMKRLQKLHPFKKETPRLPFPDAQPINHIMPSWQRQEIKRERLGWGKYRDLYRTDYDNDVRESDEETLREAAQIEVEKNHSLRLGTEWKKLHFGKKKMKLLAETEAKELEEQLEDDGGDDDVEAKKKKQIS